MVLCLIFAGVALVLSAVGIYGVLAYTVAQRTREFGIRMALGAQTGNVLRMVFWQGLRLAFIGLGVGLTASYFLVRLMTSLLYQVRPGDPVVFAAVSGLLTAVAVVASLVPSLKATRIDPLVALRYE
jgi:ABC-type antimicrobial peptide transport system permease subunit